MSDNIIVIGSGVSGITTALTLQLLGYDTEVITKRHPNKVTDKNKHPEFASLFPSASIIPHSVYSDQLEFIFKKSQAFFYELRKLSFPGLTTHKHFEVFEFPSPQPDYAKWMLNFQSIEELPEQNIPCINNDKQLFGWVFDCIFADWSLYFPTLLSLYQQVGGQITEQSLTSADIKNLSAQTIINCSGTGAPTLFDDSSEEQLIMRGHLLHNPDRPLITSGNGEIISYNYTPKAKVYADAEGNACDVYCYPRKDGWILGGSRQLGKLNTQNDWPTSDQSEAYTIDDMSVPRPIIDLNNEIIEHSFGHTIDIKDQITPMVGYRYIRNRKNGLRLEQENILDKIVYHNYGHGGAGVTLSWGAALQIATQISSRKPATVKENFFQRLQNIDYPD